jgi:hypothetical protein
MAVLRWGANGKMIGKTEIAGGVVEWCRAEGDERFRDWRGILITDPLEDRIAPGTSDDIPFHQQRKCLPDQLLEIAWHLTFDALSS